MEAVLAWALLSVLSVALGCRVDKEREMAGHPGTDKAWVLCVLTASVPSLLFARASSPFIGLMFCKQGLTL